ncbi:putative sucrose transporter [Erysiphe necator]|uniref:Putative sucrose transporter n=1 Tax=Uncinula necator TaxID=52586 RepID=A0A0B1P8J1_UNCNE|nr:putative sucrose transporter [Erysiphe necator]
MRKGLSSLWISALIEPAKSKSSPSRGAGVNAQYALHVWDSQEDSHNPSLQDSHSPPWVSIVFVSTSISLQHLISQSPQRLAQEVYFFFSVVPARSK